MLKLMFKLFKKGNKGFSLAELMVVVAIMGVLVAIAIPVYNSSTEKAKKGTCDANRRMIAGAAQQYITDKVVNETTPGSITLDTLGNYFQEKPRCPSGGQYDINTTTGSAISVSCDVHAPNAPK